VCVRPPNARHQPRRARFPPRRRLHAVLGVVSEYQYHDWMDLRFTAIFRRVPEGYIGFVEELPGANTQGATLDQARANLQEAISLVLEANRTLAQEDAGPDAIREPIKVTG